MIASLAARHRELGITTPDVEKARELAVALLDKSGGDQSGEDQSGGDHAGGDQSGGDQPVGRVSREALLATFEQAGQMTKAQRGSI
ncbi:hypothetical protein NHF46_18820 [Arthrobacter alpinus]|nr:hypothetical protein [Arthrobacter alpinus]